LLNEKNKLWKKLGENLQKYKEELQYENDRKKENEYDIKQEEKNLEEKLKIMTKMAEKIDEDNRKLIKMNEELKIEFKSQD